MLCRKLNSLLHIKIPSRHIKFTKEAPVQSHYDNAKKNNALIQLLSLIYGVSHIVPYCVYTYAVSHPSTTMLSDYVDYTPYLCRNFVNILLIYTYCHFLLGPHL